MVKIVINSKKEEEEQLPEPELQAKQEPVEEPNIFEKEEKPELPMQVSLNMRRGTDGRLMIFDHDHIDIVYLPEKMKLITFSKQDYSDIVYETQNRFFDYMSRKGLVSPEVVRGGNVYGSLEGVLMKPKEELPLEHLLVLNISKWLTKEKPALDMDKEYEKEFTAMLTEPDQEDSTELGEVPQEEMKGSIPKYASKRFIGGWW